MTKKNIFKDVWVIDKYSKELENTTKKNISRIKTENDIKKAHAKIEKILKNAKQTDNEYFEYKNFCELVKRLKDEKTLKSETIKSD